MSNSLVPAAIIPAELEIEINRLTTDELRAELTLALSLTVQHLLRLAVIVRTLEERGEDLSDVRIGLLGFLRRIAYGHLLPDLVVRFAAYPLMIQRLGGLPLPDQQLVAAGQSVKLMVKTDHGFDHRMVDPTKLTRAQVFQVFATDHIRGDDEQIMILEDRGSRPPKVSAARPIGHIRPDPNRGGLIVKRTFLPQAQVIEALAALRPESPADEQADSQVIVKITPTQHKRLKIRATEGGTTLQELLLRAIRAAGLI